MASIVGICNAALISLGASPIMSLSDDKEESRVCQARFEDVRDEVLSVHPWNCALAKAELARSSTDPLFGFAYAYPLPTSPYCLRVLYMDEEAYGYAWKIVGRTLETDSETANIEYIKRLTDPNEMPAMLRGAISARLAAEIAYKLSASHTIAEGAWKLYGAKIAEAISRDGLEGKEDIETTDSWIAARG